MGEEGYAIVQQGQRLFLIGGARRGPLNAVYCLLEEDLCCRWYAPQATRVLRRPTDRSQGGTALVLPLGEDSQYSGRSSVVCHTGGMKSMMSTAGCAAAVVERGRVSYPYGRGQAEISWGSCRLGAFSQAVTSQVSTDLNRHVPASSGVSAVTLDTEL